MYMYVCVYIYIYMYVCVCIYIYLSLSIYIYIYIHTHVCFPSPSAPQETYSSNKEIPLWWWSTHAIIGALLMLKYYTILHYTMIY